MLLIQPRIIYGRRGGSAKDTNISTNDAQLSSARFLTSNPTSTLSDTPIASVSRHGTTGGAIVRVHRCDGL